MALVLLGDAWEPVRLFDQRRIGNPLAFIDERVHTRLCPRRNMPRGSIFQVPFSEKLSDD
jgi:hypothetical protein